MYAYPPGQASAVRCEYAPRFTTTRIGTLVAATLTLFAGLSACSAQDSVDPVSSPNSAVSSSGSSTSTEASITTSAASSDYSHLVNATTVPGLGDVPTLPLSIEDVYTVDPAPLQSDTETLPFVQGLEFEPDGSLLVGTGKYAESQIYRLPQWLSNPAVAAANVTDLAPDLFGEGITRHGDSIWQLTWQQGRAIERDVDTLIQRREVPLDTEGWGACSFADTIVTSDGTGTLTFRSTEDLSPKKRLKVTAAGHDTVWLNELECAPVNGAAGAADTISSAEGEIWANVWQSPFIYRINARDGKVTGIVDARELYSDLISSIDATQFTDLDVMNGIALIPQGVDITPGTRAREADAVGRQFLLTGKKWPVAYRVLIGQ